MNPALRKYNKSSSKKCKIHNVHILNKNEKSNVCNENFTDEINNRLETTAEKITEHEAISKMKQMDTKQIKQNEQKFNDW